MRTKKPALPLFVALFIALLGLAQGCSKPGQPQQAARPQNKDVILATTTSTQDSGLLDKLVPMFEQKTGYKVKTIAVGTGAALEMGKKGEADVLLVHSPKSEKELVDSGVGINYRLVMHNDFIIVGPPADPAGIKGGKTVDAFKKIAEKRAVFVSRGDESGTHKKEKEIWTAAGLKPEGNWYLSSGAGMGQTLTIASDKEGYTLTDRATYLAQKKNLKLDVLLQGDASLLNIYHVLQVNPEKFNKVNKDGAKAFVDFMVSPDTQKIIGEFGRDQYGEPLFFPDAGKKDEDPGR
ncbi:MAG: substrate-binding domain-containing protein [Firmicutes bacterium]|nr:substrate-binding domain-containing protein [Bacillota bacterium]